MTFMISILYLNVSRHGMWGILWQDYLVLTFLYSTLYRCGHGSVQTNHVASILDDRTHSGKFYALLVILALPSLKLMVFLSCVDISLSDGCWLELHSLIISDSSRFGKCRVNVWVSARLLFAYLRSIAFLFLLLETGKHLAE